MKEPIEDAYKKNSVKVEGFEALFEDYKKNIYLYLDQQLKSNQKSGDIAQDPEILEIFEQVPSLSMLLKIFPRFLIKLKK